MAAFAQEMELLSRQLSQAHRAAIQAELLAAGLEEVNHPMLVSLLQCAEEDPAYPCQAQRDLAQQLHVSPAAVANALKGLERSGCIRREPWQPGAVDGKRPGGGGRLPGGVPAGVPDHAHRLLPGGAGPSAGL